MNHLSGVDRLANRFSVMQHAQSKANAGGIIVSRIDNDRQGDYGLTEHGRQQALAAAQRCGLPGIQSFTHRTSPARGKRQRSCAHTLAPRRWSSPKLSASGASGPGKGRRPATTRVSGPPTRPIRSTRTATLSPRPLCWTGRPRSLRSWSGGTAVVTSCWSLMETHCRSCRRASRAWIRPGTVPCLISPRQRSASCASGQEPQVAA